MQDKKPGAVFTQFGAEVTRQHLRLGPPEEKVTREVPKQRVTIKR